MDSREAFGESTEKLSLSCLVGTAVREEVSEEKMVELLVADEADDFMLAASKDLLGPFEESVVDTES